MSALMERVLNAGAVPVLYRRTPINPKATEHEFRWKVYHNASLEKVKVEYNLTREQHAHCVTIFARAAAKMKPPC